VYAGSQWFYLSEADISDRPIIREICSFWALINAFGINNPQLSIAKPEILCKKRWLRPESSGIIPAVVNS
jgi:hypothetical protein